MSQLRDMLDLDLDYVLDEQEATEEYYEKSNQQVRPWSFGKIPNSLTGVYALGGTVTRSPGRYFVVDPDNGRMTDEPLRDTHEYIHPSVRARMKLDGPGYDDVNAYTPRALKDWKLIIEEGALENGKPGRPDIYWRLTTGQKNVSTRVLPESPLWPLERELLEMEQDREIERYVLDPPISAESKSRSSKRNRSRR
jgi:hypothetical protein